MSKTVFEHKYEIGENVYHIRGESKKGIILDLNYSLRYNEVKYRVIFGMYDADDLWCQEDELTDEPNFN